MVNVLITGIGSTTAISVVKGLRAQDEIPIRIIGTDINEERTIAGSAFCDKFFQVPLAVDNKYILKLIKICKEENVNILIPIIDIELKIIAESVKKFEELGIKVCVSDISVVETCNDKYKTYEFFKHNNIPTPCTILPDKLDKMNLRFPLIIKPRNGVSSINTFKVSSPQALEFFIKKVKKPVLQEYVQGKEFTIDVLCDFENHALAVVPRERIETKAGISYKGKTVKDLKLIEYGKLIAQNLGVNGPCNIQCRVNGDIIKFFEVNPRFSGSLPLTIKAGVNSPLILLKLVTGEDVSERCFDFKENVFMCRYWEEVFYEERNNGD